MARLAAYYQEDFHYAPISHGPKQRKAAYVVYEEPKNNLFGPAYLSNGENRIRALGSSDPSLGPTTYSPRTAVMTLKARPRPLNYKLIEQSRLAMQRLENLYEPPEVLLSPYAVAQLEADMLERESLCLEDTYRRSHKSRHRTSKRMSYNDPCDSYHGLQDRSFDTSVGESFPLNGGVVCADPREPCLTPPVSFRSDSSHGRWQQWPWNASSLAVATSPSPHDSGLSSQSITSSPSLEAEPLSLQSGCCSCSPQAYAEPARVVSPPGRYDSGRSSPGVYSVTSRGKRALRRRHQDVVYVQSDLDDEYARSQVRYGVLGIVNEPVPALPGTDCQVSNNSNYVSSNGNYVSSNGEYASSNGNYVSSNGNHVSNNGNYVSSNGNYASSNGNHVSNNGNYVSSNGNYVSSNGGGHATYYYVEENAGPVRVPKPRSRKHHVKPGIVIVEPSESSCSNKDSSSPEQPDTSDKSPDSSVSSPAPDPPSLASSVNDPDAEVRRKSKKRTEREIRELEDMYQKCNLGDRDLLERAERRDLPTQHQLRSGGGPPSLTRSKSDTFYEMLSSTYRNPYEKPARAPPLRRSGVPDIVADDMAIRKHNKPATTASVNPMENTVTYMLCSSHFTPTVPNGRDMLFSDYPDVEYDDLSYRKHYFGKKSKILDPQPPFGIPLRPPPPQKVYNDYLHAIPNGGPPPLCHPRWHPDVVRDDLAYRTLRKDEPEVVYHEVRDVPRKTRA